MSDKLKSQLESVLLVSSKPISFNKLKEIVGADNQPVKECLDELSREYQESERGMRLILNNGQAQLVSSPENAKLVQG